MSLKNTSALFGYQQITVTATAFPIVLPAQNTPSGINGKPTYAIIQAEAQAVRWRDDGADPTTTVGMVISAGGELRYDGNLNAIRFIAVVAGAILNVSLYS